MNLRRIASIGSLKVEKTEKNIELTIVSGD